MENFFYVIKIFKFRGIFMVMFVWILYLGLLRVLDSCEFMFPSAGHNFRVWVVTDIHRNKQGKPCLLKNIILVWTMKRSNELSLLSKIDMESIHQPPFDKLHLCHSTVRSSTGKLIFLKLALVNSSFQE